MKMSKTIKGALIVLSIFGAFSVWYDWKYSMDEAEGYKVNSPSTDYSLLIATQGSEYKNRVTRTIVDVLSKDGVFINVMDIHNLKSQNVDDYTAIVLIHTIEMWKAPKCVRDFVEQTDKTKLFALATSGDGTYKIDGVDGITSASPILDSEKHANQIVTWYTENFKKL